MNSTLIPFLLMFICSVALIHYIFKMRKRVKYQSSKESKSHVKDIQFSVTILLMNVNFLVFNLPICVLNFISVAPFLLESRFDYFFYSQYFFNFYIYLFFNKLFAREFWSFLGVENTYWFWGVGTKMMRLESVLNMKITIYPFTDVTALLDLRLALFMISWRFSLTNFWVWAGSCWYLFSVPLRF